jgi:hypothetical protein
LVVSALILLGIALFVITTGLSGLVLLPHLPQELGDTMPRCLVLDVEAKRLSPELAIGLFDDSSSSVTSEVRRTHEVAVHFSNSDVMMIELPRSPQMHRRVVELQRKLVVATTTCSVPIARPT